MGSIDINTLSGLGGMVQRLQGLMREAPVSSSNELILVSRKSQELLRVFIHFPFFLNLNSILPGLTNGWISTLTPALH